MKITTGTYMGRKVWQLDNEALTFTMSQGGGHIAGLTLHEKGDINPMWAPIWDSMEPWEYRREKHAAKYELRLLASILGHNLCLGYFGDPSADEAKQGLEVHGEAPVARWKLIRKKVTAETVSMTCGCDLPIAQMSFERTVMSRRGSRVVHVVEEVRSLSKRDLPFTMCEHATFGPPFLEKGVTVFDMPATRGHTFPGPFSKAMRMKPDAAFTWPKAPSARGGKLDLRMISTKDRASSDFSTQLMDPRQETAWFSALNPRLGLLVAYVWRREDFPWVGNWEENYGRHSVPWVGKSLTRGMEFANTPFPIGLRKAVDMGTFQGEKTFRWLPAMGRIEIGYDIVIASVSTRAKGVHTIERTDRGVEVDLL